MSIVQTVLFYRHNSGEFILLRMPPSEPYDDTDAAVSIYPNRLLDGVRAETTGSLDEFTRDEGLNDVDDKMHEDHNTTIGENVSELHVFWNEYSRNGIREVIAEAFIDTEILKMLPVFVD